MRRVVTFTVPLLLSLMATLGATAQEPQPASRPDQQATVSVKYEKGTRIAVDNRTTGPIVVIGWDRDQIEATAISDRGAETVDVKTGFLFDSPVVALKANYAERERTDETVDSFGRIPEKVFREIGSFFSRPFQDNTRPGDILLEVRVPRSAELEPIRVFRSEVLVSGLTTSVAVLGEKSTIRLKNVGGGEVRTQSGEVEIDGTAGLADVVTTSGVITVRNAGGDVRALSLSGRIDIDCARGRVDASNTDGPINVRAAGSDVSANTTYSLVHFIGAIRGDGRYYLKSMSGTVEMEVPADSPGFTASLSSYKGQLENDFELKMSQQPATAQASRRVIGRHGNGSAHITLDSFDGSVRLKKLAPTAVPRTCNLP